MKRLITICVILGLFSPARAYLVSVYTQQDPIQDDWNIFGEVHELGNQPPFPNDEWITSIEVPWGGYVPCPAEYGGGGAVQVQITNMTGIVFGRLYYVSDPETSLTNYDEWVGNAGQGDAQEAFLIDWWGENQPLVYESKTQDAVFEIGETWEFVIQEYSNTLGLSPAAFGTLGIAGASSGDISSSGSIIPEPCTITLFGLGSLALVRWRRKT